MRTNHPLALDVPITDHHPIQEPGHVVQFYDDDAFLVDTVARFVGAGLGGGEAVVVLATPAHREHVERKVCAYGVDLQGAREAGRYVALDASDALARFMVDGWPDEKLFDDFVGGLIAGSAEGEHRRVRAFGEMVALLYLEGKQDAAVRLEELWNGLATRDPFALLCAYPIGGFRRASDGGHFLRICGEHSVVIPAEDYPAREEAEQRLRVVSQLQQKAVALAAEVAEREDLEIRRAQLAAIIESSDDAIVGKSLDGIVTSWNHGAERIFGYAAEEMIGQPIARLIPADHPEDLARILGAIRRGERVEHFETERVRKDGRRIRVSLSVSPIRDASGRIVGASKIARDVSERARAEEALRESRDLLATLNRTSKVLSAELDLQKVLQTVTDATTQLIGATSGAFFDVAGNAVPTEHLHAFSGGRPEAFVAFPGFHDTEPFAATFRGEPVVRLDDATGLPVRSYLAVPVVSRGVVLGGLFFGHPEPDMFTERDERVAAGLAAQAAIAIDNARLYDAERTARQTAEAASHAKDEFLSVVSHELRTPLSPILTWTRMLQQHRLDGERTERALATIERCARAQAQLVEDLLDVSRIMAGKLRLEVRPVRLPDVVDAAVDVVRPAAEAKGVRLQTVLDPGVGTVVGDAERIQQIAWNLLSNAIKFTPEGGHVTVAVEQAGSHARITVNDTGRGISPDFLPHVFERFRQADTTTSRAHGGLGLGLAIVRHLVEAHGGTVDAESAGEGRGATFRVTFPLLRRVPAAEARSWVEPRVPRDLPSLAGLRVLVVDDEPDSNDSVRELLAVSHAEVEVAASAEHARQVLRRWTPDVIVSDVGMPGEDGYAFIASLRARDESAKVPAVALTAYASRGDKIRLLAAGFQAHVPKPVDAAELIDVVANVARSSGQF